MLLLTGNGMIFPEPCYCVEPELRPPGLTYSKNSGVINIKLYFLYIIRDSRQTAVCCNNGSESREYEIEWVSQ